MTDLRVHTDRFSIPMRDDRHSSSLDDSDIAHAANQDVDIYVFTTGSISASVIKRYNNRELNKLNEWLFNFLDMSLDFAECVANQVALVFDVNYVT